ncbi:hypothetical protein ABW19_dt0205369 [Dactylella cylindrospora]|nr:hypothetical protein ABW19_dt0205369 [Dactylella cylindrospora]
MNLPAAVYFGLLYRLGVVGVPDIPSDTSSYERLPLPLDPTEVSQNFSIIIEDADKNLRIEIPGHQVLRRIQDQQSDGFVLRDDPENMGLWVYFFEDLDREPTFGLPFLAGALLAMDTDRNVFGLAQVLEDVSGQENLVPSLPSACRTTDALNPNTTSDGSGSSSDSPNTTENATQGPSIASIVGGTIGGVAALTLLVAGYFAWRRKKPHGEDNPTIFTGGKVELDGRPASAKSPVELP